MQRQRYEILDGLRGLAALTVVVFHFFSAYAPTLLSEESSLPWWGSDTPLAVLFNGGFAVSVFFALSGFVVSNSAAQRKMPVAFNLVSRYFRLAIPVVASTIIAWALLAISPHTVAQLKAVEPHAWLNWTYDGTEPGILAAIKSGLFDVFIHGGSQFNNVLWTMKIEFLGSFAIYLLYGLANPRFYVPALIIFALAAVYGRHPEYSAFAIGVLMREGVTTNRLPTKFAWGALAFGIVIGAMMQGYSVRLGLPLKYGDFALGEPHKVWHVMAAGALLYAVLGLPILRAFLSSRPLRFLGDISFGVYLVHVPLLYTAFVPFYLVARTSQTGIAALFITFLTVAVLVGYAFTLLVDRPTIGAIRRAQLHFRQLSAKTEMIAESE
jgi:peptidoglycan/LPS O-acetylase OafA/YrhL